MHVCTYVYIYIYKYIHIYICPGSQWLSPPAAHGNGPPGDAPPPPLWYVGWGVGCGSAGGRGGDPPHPPCGKWCGCAVPILHPKSFCSVPCTKPPKLTSAMLQRSLYSAPRHLPVHSLCQDFYKTARADLHHSCLTSKRKGGSAPVKSAKLGSSP